MFRRFVITNQHVKKLQKLASERFYLKLPENTAVHLLRDGEVFAIVERYPNFTKYERDKFIQIFSRVLLRERYMTETDPRWAQLRFWTRYAETSYRNGWMDGEYAKRILQAAEEEFGDKNKQQRVG